MRRNIYVVILLRNMCDEAVTETDNPMTLYTFNPGGLWDVYCCSHDCKRFKDETQHTPSGNTLQFYTFLDFLYQRQRCKSMHYIVKS